MAGFASFGGTCKGLSIIAFLLILLQANGQVLDTIGVTGLRQAAPVLTGAGVRVGQAEADASDAAWEVNPAYVSQPVSLFTWISGNGEDATFPNGGGYESWHANLVGDAFYGFTNGVAPGVAHVDNYEAKTFYEYFVKGQVQVTPAIINQSYIFSVSTTVENDFDNYSAKFGTLFVNGAGNGGPVSPPATAYNGIGVGAYGGYSSVGPTTDGRCKPDITAPAQYTSYSTPLAAGVAALLLQAAREGTNVSTATNALTLKALLLNGATKPADWTNSVAFPLDARYGAGIVNALNSYRQLRRGKQAFNVNTQVSAGGSHLPPTTGATIAGRRGWDHNTITSTITKDSVNHYFFEVSGSASTSQVFNATLAWNRGANDAMANNLDLFLYNVSNNVLVASSRSTANNVEHISIKNLPGGRYNLQVLKTTRVILPFTETYALAWDFGNLEPQLASPMVSNGTFRAQVIGEPGQTMVVQSTTNYQNWTSILTNTTSAQGTFTFTNVLSGMLKVFRVQQVQ